jgi:hypothetical protein
VRSVFNINLTGSKISLITNVSDHRLHLPPNVFKIFLVFLSHSKQTLRYYSKTVQQGSKPFLYPFIIAMIHLFDII